MRINFEICCKLYFVAALVGRLIYRMLDEPDYCCAKARVVVVVAWCHGVVVSDRLQLYEFLNVRGRNTQSQMHALSLSLSRNVFLNSVITAYVFSANGPCSLVCGERAFCAIKAHCIFCIFVKFVSILCVSSIVETSPSMWCYVCNTNRNRSIPPSIR